MEDNPVFYANQKVSKRRHGNKKSRLVRERITDVDGILISQQGGIVDRKK